MKLYPRKDFSNKKEFPNKKEVSSNDTEKEFICENILILKANIIFMLLYMTFWDTWVLFLSHKNEVLLKIFNILYHLH